VKVRFFIILEYYYLYKISQLFAIEKKPEAFEVHDKTGRKMKGKAKTKMMKATKKGGYDSPGSEEVSSIR
jgi:hypothetical protein